MANNTMLTFQKSSELTEKEETKKSKDKKKKKKSGNSD